MAEVNAGCFVENPDDLSLYKSEYIRSTLLQCLFSFYIDSDDDGDDEGDDGDDDDAHGTSTMVSPPTHMPQSPSPSVRGLPKASVQPSPAPSPSSTAGTSTVPEIDDAVREANKTSGFLDPSGAVVDGSLFVLELELSNLPERKRIWFVTDFGHNSSRSFMIYYDPSPVTTNITKVGQTTRTQDAEDYTFEVKFSTRLLSKPDPKLLSCPSVTDPLSDLISAQKNRSLTPDHLLAMRKAAEKFSSCRNETKALNPVSLVTVEGVQPTMIPTKKRFTTCEIKGGDKLEGPSIAVEFSIDKGREVEIEFRINGSSGVSFSGTPVNDQTESFSLGPSSVQPAEPPSVAETLGHSRLVVAESSDSLNIARLLGQITSSVVGASIGISFVINVGTPFLALVYPNRKTLLQCYILLTLEINLC